MASSSAQVTWYTYDDRFLKATCPTTTKGTAIVQKGSGVKVNHFYYWNNAFRNPEVIKTAVPVRYDPFDLSTAFAFVQSQWITCCAPYLNLEGHTEKELLIATTELRRQARRDGSRADLSAERLATHMSIACAKSARSSPTTRSVSTGAFLIRRGLWDRKKHAPMRSSRPRSSSRRAFVY